MNTSGNDDCPPTDSTAATEVSKVRIHACIEALAVPLIEYYLEPK